MFSWKTINHINYDNLLEGIIISVFSIPVNKFEKV